MIIVDKGEVTITGREEIVVAEFAVLARNLREILTKQYGEKKALKKLDSAYEDSKLSEDELEAKVMEALADMIKDKGFLEKIVDTIKKMEEE